MNIRYASSKSNHQEQTTPSLALNSNAFAVKPELWRRLLNINKIDYRTDVAETVDLSIKSWICAKGIVKAKCSHIISLYTENLKKQTDAEDVKSLVESYLAPINYHSRFLTVIKGEDFDKHLDNFQPRTNKLDDTCQIDAFFKNKDNRNPFLNIDVNTIKYGVMKIKNGQCANTQTDLNHIDINACPSKYERASDDFLFQYTSDKKIRHKNNCLTTINFYVVIRSCSNEDKNQIWQFDDQGRIVHELSNSCLIHVTDPSTKGRQIVMIQSCTNDEEGLFSEWSFLDY